MFTKNGQGNITQYRISSVTHKLCQKVWLELLILPRKYFDNWRQAVGLSRNILPLYHGLTGRVSDDNKQSMRDAVSEYIDTIAALYGFGIPVHVGRADGQYVDSCFDTNNFILLPPQYSIRSPYDVHDFTSIMISVFPPLATPAQTVQLLSPSQTYPQLSTVQKEAPNTLTETRKNMLREDVFEVLVKTRSNMSASTRSFWLDELGGKNY